jgi:uncharacterized pyridoxamine 5'-phosphate oxidase family protein
MSAPDKLAHVPHRAIACPFKPIVTAYYPIAFGEAKPHFPQTPPPSAGGSFCDGTRAVAGRFSKNQRNPVARLFPERRDKTCPNFQMEKLALLLKELTGKIRKETERTMKAVPIIPALLLLTAFSAMSGHAIATQQKETSGAGMQEVYEFIKGCGHYFLATVDGDQPRVRPFGTVAIFEGRFYIQTGKKKNVSKQMARNPKIEICAYDGKEKWVRVQAVAVNDDRIEAKRFMLDSYPELKKMYSAEDANTQVLYLQNARATFHSFSGDSKMVEF